MRSINKVTLVGNLTRDPETKVMPNGGTICAFTIATNREWMTEAGKKEETEFHNVVAWDKLADLCSRLLAKSTKIYLEGRLRTRSWENESGVKLFRTEVIASEFIILTGKSLTTYFDPKEGEYDLNQSESDTDFPN